MNIKTEADLSMISASPLRNGSTSLKKAIDKDLPVC